MAASGYTPIILFNSTTASNVPTTSNLAVGELAINIPDGKLYYNKSGTITVLANANFATSVSTISFGTTGLTPSTATNGVVTVAGTLAVANGGTGQTTAGAGFNALSPITTTGDLIIGNGTNSATRLAIGANTYVLTSNGTTASWVAPSGGGGSQATATTLGTVYASTLNTGVTTALGYQSAASSTSNGTTSIGYQALYNQTSSSTVNTAIGYQAGYTLTTGSGSNVFVGATAGYYATGTNNTALGYACLANNNSGATGSYNTSIGSLSLANNTTASYNTAVGYQAGYSNTTASYNTAVGYQSSYTNTTSTNTTAIGSQALYSGGGYYDTAIGFQAGYSVTSGSGGSNTFVGWKAGQYSNALTTGSSCTYIGCYASPSSATAVSELVVCTGNSSVGKGSYTGYINGGTGGTYQGNNSAAWSITSDQRLKKNIVDNNVGLDKVIQIQVRNFEYRTEDEVTDLPKNQAIKKQGVQLGVIAQELQQVLPDCVKQESTGVLAVDSTDIMYHMINAIKELNAEIQALKSKVGI